jgi:hypothetical protein
MLLKHLHTHGHMLRASAQHPPVPESIAALLPPVGRPGKLGALEVRQAMAGSPPGPHVFSPATPCLAPQSHNNKSGRRKPIL